jgi:hypothetical protein
VTAWDTIEAKVVSAFEVANTGTLMIDVPPLAADLALSVREA